MKRNYHTSLSFLDLLFNTLLCFAALFALSFLLINPSKKDKNVEVKAEFIITVTWPDELNNDVDTYVEDPQGRLVAFMRREEGLMHLDRDDVGRFNDLLTTPFGDVEYKENREVVTLRGSIPGEYVVNVHMYTRRSKEIETPVTIQLDKINPFQIITVKNVILHDTGEESTAFRFVIDQHGDVSELNELPKSLTKKVDSPFPTSRGR
jgi:hypothetical protein|tara:strand:+ start:67648 stop:68268 length:621 start_codon:yes stop_codon:yes gene_type:complete